MIRRSSYVLRFSSLVSEPLVEIDLLPQRDRSSRQSTLLAPMELSAQANSFHRDAKGCGNRMMEADGSGWIEIDGTFLDDNEMEQKLLDALHNTQDDPDAALRMLAGFYKATERWEDYGRSLEELVLLSGDDKKNSRLLLTLGGESKDRKDWKAAARGDPDRSETRSPGPFGDGGTPRYDARQSSRAGPRVGLRVLVIAASTVSSLVAMLLVLCRT